MWDAEIKAAAGYTPEPVTIIEKGMTIRVEPHLRKPGQTLPTVPFSGGKATLGRACDAIATKLRDKAKKSYKHAELPYVVALNVIEVGLDMEEVIDALLGREQVRLHLNSDLSIADHEIKRHHSGIWQFKGRPSNTRLTAVMLFRNICCLDYTPTTPVSFYHPFVNSTRPLSHCEHITRYLANERGNKYVCHEGSGLSNVMRL